MIVLIGMAVGVDYSLFYLKREREERARGRSTRDAVEIAAETSGHSILVSGVAVVVAMVGPVRRRRRHVQLAGHRFDPRGRDRRARLDHRAAGPAGQARPLGRPAARAAAVAAQPPDRTRWDQPSRARPRSSGALSSHSSSAAPSWSALAVPMLGMKVHSANLETLPASIPEVATMRDLVEAFPQRGCLSRGRRARGRRRRSRRSGAALADLERAATATGELRRRGATGSVSTSADGAHDGPGRWPSPSRRATRASTTRSSCCATTSLRRRSDGLHDEQGVTPSGGDAAESFDSAQHQLDVPPDRDRLRRCC